MTGCIYIHTVKWLIVKPINICIPSQGYLSVYVMRTSETYSPSKFPVFNTVSWIIVIMLCMRSLDLSLLFNCCLVAKSRPTPSWPHGLILGNCNSVSWTNYLPISPAPQARIHPYSLCFYVFDFLFHWKYHPVIYLADDILSASSMREGPHSNQHCTPMSSHLNKLWEVL